MRIQLVRAMADIEHRLAYGTSDRLQLGALCGAFAGAADGWGAAEFVHVDGAAEAAAVHTHTCQAASVPEASMLASSSCAEAKEGIVKAAQ